MAGAWCCARRDTVRLRTTEISEIGRRESMKRTALTAAFFGSAAAALMAGALATPASAQSTTYPQGTDCTVIQDSASRTDCLNQQSQSQQMPNGQMSPSNTAPKTGS